MNQRKDKLITLDAYIPLLAYMEQNRNEQITPTYNLYEWKIKEWLLCIITFMALRLFLTFHILIILKEVQTFQKDSEEEKSH